ncbi:hypothetical protein [Verrucosispora sp. WMMD1129]|uniref:hypothetical protein n=1 Tax=Verrucosispora sp. WMMD1129 TaxID=3016093 RepID=UPI00249ACAA1|nr:hypothetical protein [Verrucosispora sp. WMMD1129]WFE45324.1 hypothetical protein O7624_13665 [Verrucosispora sp. WMMD1129]
MTTTAEGFNPFPPDDPHHAAFAAAEAQETIVGTAYDSELWPEGWERYEPAADVATQALNAGATTVPLVNLPDDFWSARPLFKAVREAAWASITSADAVLGSMLARAGAMVDHRIKFDSGRGPTGSLNTFVNLIGPSGAGKTEAMRTATRLLLPPRYLARLDGSSDPELFRDGIGLGTGEGMAEAYMGWIQRETGELDRKGEPKTEKVRAQVRHNAFFYADEGQTLTKMMKERQGTTVGMAIRTAWTGGALGQANAREENTRFLPDGSYSMGLLIGYQPNIAQDLLADGGPGTPQRFLWLSAIDPNIPDEPVPLPDPVRITLGEPGPAGAAVVSFPPDLRAQLRREQLARQRGEVVVDELDSHVPLMRCKLAALLALLDERFEVTWDDWELGGLIWATSCAVRDRLIEFGRQEAERNRLAQIERRRQEAVAVRLAERGVDSSTERVAAWICDKVRERERIAKGKLRKLLAARDRDWFEPGLAHAEALRWVRIDDDRYLTPGPARVDRGGGQVDTCPPLGAENGGPGDE